MDEYTSNVNFDLPGSFFGMTTMGDPQYFKSNVRKHFKKEVYEYPVEAFLSAFEDMSALNKHPGCCRRALLPKVFAMAMGRELEDYELEYVLKWVRAWVSESTFSIVWNFQSRWF